MCTRCRLNRYTTAFQIVTVIPIAIVLGTIGGYSISWANELAASRRSPRAAGLLFIPPLLMIVFRQKYPRRWFDLNLQLLRFGNRVGVYLELMHDRYPSTIRSPPRRSRTMSASAISPRRSSLVRSSGG